MKYLLFFIILGCADLTKSGAKVKFIEHSGTPLEIQDTADKLAGKNGCQFLGYVDAESALFPGSYSVHENEVHSALRNRAAKLGANLVIANFYKKPARGIGMICPDEFFSSNANL